MTKPNDELKGMPSEIWAHKPSDGEFLKTGYWSELSKSKKTSSKIKRTKYIRSDLAPTSQWREISSALRDGTVVMLLRPKATAGRSSQIIFAAFKDGIWQWPDTAFNPYDEGRFHIQLQDGIFCSDEFTHWQPLPAPPTKDLADAGKDGV